MIPPAIPILLALSSPTAILKAIAAVIIDSFQAAPFGGITHIIIKRLKVMPLLADRDASAPIVFVGGILGIVATLKHIYPSVIDARAYLSMFPAILNFKAATASSPPRSQIISLDDGPFPTVAVTVPVRSPIFRCLGTGPLSNKPPKPNASQVYAASARKSRIFVSHDGTFLCKGCVEVRAVEGYRPWRLASL